MKISPRWNGEVSISYDALKTVKDGTKAQIAVVVPEYINRKFLAQRFSQQCRSFFRNDAMNKSAREKLSDDDRQAINRAADFPSFGQSKALHE